MITNGVQMNQICVAPTPETYRLSADQIGGSRIRLSSWWVSLAVTAHGLLQRRSARLYETRRT